MLDLIKASVIHRENLLKYWCFQTVTVTSKKLGIMAEYELSGKTSDYLARRKEKKCHWVRKKKVFLQLLHMIINELETYWYKWAVVRSTDIQLKILAVKKISVACVTHVYVEGAWDIFNVFCFIFICLHIYSIMCSRVGAPGKFREDCFELISYFNYRERNEHWLRKCH